MFLAASPAALSPIAESRFAHARDGVVPHELRGERDVGVLVSARKAQSRMTVAGARLNLVAPEDTHMAAVDVLGATLAYMFRDEEGMAECLASTSASASTASWPSRTASCATYTFGRTALSTGPSGASA